jgi:hypothetical protein
MKYAKKVYECDGGFTIHPTKVVWTAMGFPKYVEFVLQEDGTCKLIPKRLV